MRYWSLLYGLVAVLAVAMFAYAPFDHEWWLPGYRETNVEALETLEALDDLDGARDELAALAEAEDPDPAVAEELRAELDRRRARLARAADEQFLTNRTRDLESRAAAASAAVGAVRSAIAAGDEGAISASVDAADEALARLDEGAGEALAELAGPEGSLDAPISTAAHQVDHLFILILVITGVTFIGTMIALVYATWRFAARPGRRADYYHGSQRLEVIWTIIPSAILIFIALYQLGAWADIKFQNTWPDVKPLAEVKARQFQWMIRYPGPDGVLDTADDLHTVNDLHFVKDSPTIIYLKSEDVLHSFFLPQLRIKQDAVPGLTIPVKFDASKPGRYELLCAELCGWGHYKMRADVTVHETQSEFDEWMEQALREQSRSQPPGAPPTATAPDVAAAPGNRVE